MAASGLETRRSSSSLSSRSTSSADTLQGDISAGPTISEKEKGFFGSESSSVHSTQPAAVKPPNRKAANRAKKAKPTTTGSTKIKNLQEEKNRHMAAKDVVGVPYGIREEKGSVEKEVHYIVPHAGPADGGPDGTGEKGREWCAIRTIYVKEYKKAAERKVWGIWKRLNFNPTTTDTCVKDPTQDLWIRTRSAYSRPGPKGKLLWEVKIHFRSMQSLIEGQVTKYSGIPSAEMCSSGLVAGCGGSDKCCGGAPKCERPRATPRIIPSAPERIFPSHSIDPKTGRCELLCHGDGVGYWTIWWQQTPTSRSLLSSTPDEIEANTACYRIVRSRPDQPDSYDYRVRGSNWYRAKIPYVKNLPPFPVDRLLDGDTLEMIF